MSCIDTYTLGSADKGMGGKKVCVRNVPEMNTWLACTAMALNWMTVSVTQRRAVLPWFGAHVMAGVL